MMTKNNLLPSGVYASYVHKCLQVNTHLYMSRYMKHAMLIFV